MKHKDPRDPYVLPQVPEDDQLFVTPDRINFAGILIDAADCPRPDAPPRCSGCGELTFMHYDTSGCIWIGCMGALKRKEMGFTDEKPSRSHLFGDQHPAVSRAVRLILSTDCYTVTETYNELSYDQQTEIARQIAGYAVRAYLAERERR